MTVPAESCFACSMMVAAACFDESEECAWLSVFLRPAARRESVRS
jgi:hypothetical protein